MTEKRFEWDNVNIAIKDNQSKKKYYTDITCIDEIVDLLNQLDEDNKQYKILVESLKDENQKLKLRLKDLGVEYY